MTQNAEKVGLTIYFVTTVKEISIRGFKFEKITLNDSLLPKEMSDYFSDLTIEPEAGRPFHLVFRANFSKQIKVSSKRYIDAIKYLPITNELDYIKFRELILEEWVTLYDKFVVTLVKHLKWQKDFALASLLDESHNTEFYWQLDTYAGNDELYMPAKVVGVHEVDNFDNVTTQDFSNFRLDSIKLSSVPVHQELWFEVERLIILNFLRAAYITMYSALEVATKYLIGRVYPDSQWLIENMPSPDLMRVYKEFINIRIADIIPESELGKLRDINGIRNQITHQGYIVEIETIKKHKEYINEWLKKINRRLAEF